MDSNTRSYSRGEAVAYARRWALSRNPRYHDFEQLGGDCTNFASQCVFAGAGVMNFSPVTGWYYRSLGERAAAWTGVQFLYKFLTGNTGFGPWARETEAGELMPGDIVQLGNSDGSFYHSPVVVETHPAILVCAHSFDCADRPLDSYDFEEIRCIHIEGVRMG